MQSKRKRKKLYVAAASIIAIILVVSLTRVFITGSITRSEIITATVGQGNVENTITASGEVLPEFEELITSSVNASIKSSLTNAGTNVKAGQSILLLDKSATENERNNLKFQLESKRNEISKLKLNLDKSFFDIKSSNAVKQLQINNLEAAVENAKRLFKAGGGTREVIQQAELNLKVALLEKKQLENEIISKQQTMLVEEREAEISARIQQNNLNELERKLKLANVVATLDGVVTYVNKNIGANVKEGETLAKIADLRSFKVKGAISDNYLSQLHTGMPAIVQFNEHQLRSQVVNIYPSVQNGVVSFDVEIDQQNNKQLRPNIKVDVFLVTDARRNVIRVANGPAFKGPESLEIFVLKGDKAERRKVRTGLANFEHVEILEGLKSGEVVITSDMSDYKNSKELRVKNSL
jgi:HlyD family secretion protein